jgi:hypothetical protein
MNEKAKVNVIKIFLILSLINYYRIYVDKDLKLINEFYESIWVDSLNKNIDDHDHDHDYDPTDSLFDNSIDCDSISDDDIQLIEHTDLIDPVD